MTIGINQITNVTLGKITILPLYFFPCYPLPHKILAILVGRRYIVDLHNWIKILAGSFKIILAIILDYM
jgi:hypothetical protein